jgi:hypothetical protein
MNWTLEVVVVPVSDVDRAKAFYAGQLGFNVDHDTTIGDGARVGENRPSVPDPLDNVGFVFFTDPDGNGWAVQQISARGAA